MIKTKNIYQRSFKLRKNIPGDPKLYKLALNKKKRKWTFLLKILERNSFPCYKLSDTTPFSFNSESLAKSFSLEWNEKQALKAHYRVLREKSWSFLAKKATLTKNRSLKGSKLPSKKATFLALWESRLDTCLWKACFFPSITEARQHIRHGFVTVNGAKVKVYGYILQEEDIITLNLPEEASKRKKENLFENNFFQNFLPQKESNKVPLQLPPKHLEISFTTLQIIFVEKPEPENIYLPYPINLSRLKV